MEKLNLFLLFLSFLNGCLINNVDARLASENIVGGTLANQGDFTYVVSVQKNELHICGGGILSDQVILSAAHCFVDAGNNFKVGHFSVVVGSEDLSHPRIRISISKVSVPVEYKRGIMMIMIRRDKADIAIAKLSQKIPGAGDALNILQLPVANPNTSKYPNYENTKPVLAGYGVDGMRVEEIGPNNNVIEIPTSFLKKLRYAETLVIPNSECSALFHEPDLMSAIIDESHICAKMKQRSLHQHEGACIGDSGGPLVLEGNIVIGVTSSGPFGCNESIYPTVYIRVSSFKSLIVNAMNDVVLPNIKTHSY